MPRFHRNATLPVLLLGLGISAASCAGDAPPPSDALRRSIVSVGVRAGEDGLRIEARTPVHDSGGAPEGAAKDALKAGGRIMEASTSLGMAMIFVAPIGAAVAIIGTPVGAAVAASRARDRAEVERAEIASWAACAVGAKALTGRPHPGRHCEAAGLPEAGKAS